MKLSMVFSAWAIMGLLVTGSTSAQDGTGEIVSWGDQVVGVDLSGGVTEITAGRFHSLGLKADGSIVAWGDNYSGQCDVPPPNAGFIAVVGGAHHSLGLKADGSIVAWGANNYSQCDVPEPNVGFVAVAAGYYHSLGLKDDGSIVAWGRNNHGQCNVPPLQTHFVAVAAGHRHSLAIRTYGSIIAWGLNNYGQCDVPAPNTGFVAVAGGGADYSWYPYTGGGHSLGLRANGSIVAWGWNDYGQCNVPAPNTDFVAVAGGYGHSLGIKGSPIQPGGLDIKPGSCQNPLNRSSRGFLPVAVIGTEDFDVAEIDLSSVSLSRSDGVGGAVAPNEGPPGPHSVFADVATPFYGEACDCHEAEGDGIDDLSMKFKRQELVEILELGGLNHGDEVEVVITGLLTDGEAFTTRTDCILIVPMGTATVQVESTAPGTFVDITPNDVNGSASAYAAFQRTYDPGTALTLTAPTQADDRSFYAWRVNGVMQAVGLTTLQWAFPGERMTEGSA